MKSTYLEVAKIIYKDCFYTLCLHGYFSKTNNFALI